MTFLSVFNQKILHPKNTETLSRLNLSMQNKKLAKTKIKIKIKKFRLLDSELDEAWQASTINEQFSCDRSNNLS